MCFDTLVAFSAYHKNPRAYVRDYPIRDVVSEEAGTRSECTVVALYALYTRCRRFIQIRWNEPSVDLSGLTCDVWLGGSSSRVENEPLSIDPWLDESVKSSLALYLSFGYYYH